MPNRGTVNAWPPVPVLSGRPVGRGRRPGLPLGRREPGDHAEPLARPFGGQGVSEAWGSDRAPSADRHGDPYRHLVSAEEQPGSPDAGGLRPPAALPAVEVDVEGRHGVRPMTAAAVI